MRRFIVMLSVVAVVLAGSAALGARQAVLAQDATPSSEESAPEGGTFDAVALAFGVDVASPIDMTVVRIGHYKGADVGEAALRKSLALLMEAIPEVRPPWQPPKASR